jgi:hypothetical protein
VQDGSTAAVFSVHVTLFAARGLGSGQRVELKSLLQYMFPAAQFVWCTRLLYIGSSPSLGNRRFRRTHV